MESTSALLDLIDSLNSRNVVNEPVISALPAESWLKVSISSVMVAAKPVISSDILLIRLPVSLECFDVALIPSIILDSVWEIFREFSLVVSERRRISPATTAKPFPASPAWDAQLPHSWKGG